MSRKINYISFLHVLSAVSVLYLHVNGCFWQFSTELYWAQANAIESFFYFAVPVFFMITGVTNLNYREKYSTKEFLLRRGKKTIIPFLAWNAVAMCFNVLIHKTQLSEISLSFFITGIMSNSIMYIYWFFWALFGIYLLIPFLSAIPKDKRPRVFWYIIAIIFVLQIIPSFILKILNIQFDLPINVSIGSVYLVYVLLGYNLNEVELTRKQKGILYLSSFICLLVHAIGTYSLSIKHGMIIETFKGYDNVPCFIYSAGVFVLIKSIAPQIKSKQFWKYIEILSGYTFPIYLMHIYLWEISFRVGVSTKSLLVRLFMPFAIMAICIIITKVLRKIPFLKLVVP